MSQQEENDAATIDHVLYEAIQAGDLDAGIASLKPMSAAWRKQQMPALRVVKDWMDQSHWKHGANQKKWKGKASQAQYEVLKLAFFVCGSPEDIFALGQSVYVCRAAVLTRAELLSWGALFEIDVEV